MTDTEQFLQRFTIREERLLSRLPKGHDLPIRLNDWRMWIQDSNIYLNDLRDYVEKFEARRATSKAR